MNPAELNYTAVSTFDQNERHLNMDSEKNVEKGLKYRQFLAATIANVSSAALGVTLGWTSPVNPKLTEITLSDNPLGRIPNSEEISWIGALVALGALIAPYAAGPLAERIGRKWTLISSAIFFIVALVLLATASSIGQMYAARLIQGFGVGFVMTVSPMYCGEISSDDSRGAIGSFMQLFIVLGILFVYIVGPYVTYVALQYICLVLPVGFAIGMFFMPESPYYYFAKGRKDEAINALCFLRGKSAEGVKEEAEMIEGVVAESLKNAGTVKDLFNVKGNRKALIICCGLISFQQLSGINVVLFYSQSIFQKTGSSLDSAIASIIVGTVQVLASGCTPLIVDRLGRRIILLISAGGMAIALAAMGLYFLFDIQQASFVGSIGWLPILSLIIFVSVYCVGFGPLPWAVLGEMFPSNVKSKASSIVASVCWIFGFLVTKYFSAMDEAVGSDWAFWIFGILCIAAFAFTLTLVMETKGMSLQQIQDKLNE